MIDSILRFIKSADFYKSITFITAAIIPILITKFYLDAVEIGIAIAMGVFYNSPTNIAGSVKHRIIGMLVSTLLTFLSTLIMGYASLHLFTLLIALGILTFSISYLSIFGFRGSLVSFAGMLAVVLSFANSYVYLSIFEYALLVGIGGIWYLLLSGILNYLNPQMYIEELLSDTFKLTGKYLNTRARLLVEKGNREKLNTKLFKYQADLSDKHETLREVILTRRQKSGFSNQIQRKLLLFIETVDMLELAIANPLDYKRVDVIFKNSPKNITLFVDLISEMSNHLNHISKAIIRGEKVKENFKISFLIKRIKKSIDKYKKEVGISKGREYFLILINLFEYQATQIQKLKFIEKVLNVLNEKVSLISENKADKRFLTPQDYGFNKLKENFSFKSSIFRHSLRLAIMMVVGFLVGKVFSFQNSYWILITLLVIMRPSYGLTKERMKHRVVGTLVGVSIAMVLVFLIRDTYVFGVLAAITLTLALSLVQLNYRTFAVFITLHIVFMYAIYSENVFEAIQFRIIDTIVGASLATISSLFLFPSWEFMTVDESFTKALEANTSYVKKISEKYRNKNKKITEYKLVRKNVFLAMGDLNATFQRMTQEPKSKQKYFSEIYNIVVLINAFLSSLASLGTYIQSHKTTAISKSVEILIQNIIDNLKNAKKLLNNKELTHLHFSGEVEQATKSLEHKYIELTRNYDKIMFDIKEENQTKQTIALEIQETKLVLEQLSHLYILSKNMVKSVKEYIRKSKK